MRAIAVTKPDADPTRALALIDAPKPKPGPGQVLVRVHAVGLNPVDWKLAEGGHPNWSMPHVLGLDAAGVVEAVGPDVTEWQLGTRVVWHGDLSRSGVFAEWALAEAHALACIPAAVSFEAAAALPCAGMTAYVGLLRKVKLEASQTLLVQGAAGGVGGFAVQLGKALGAKVIAFASAEQADRVRSLGAELVLDRRADDLPGLVRSANDGRGTDVFFEVANPGDARISLALLAYNAHLVSVDPLPVMTSVPNYTYAASIHEVSLGGAYLAGDRKSQKDFPVMLSDLLGRVESGKLDPLIEQRIALTDIPEGLMRLREGKLPGKTIATVV